MLSCFTLRISLTGNTYLTFSKLLSPRLLLCCSRSKTLGDKRGPRRLVTKDRAMVGQLQERILVFHPACAHACTLYTHASIAQAA